MQAKNKPNEQFDLVQGWRHLRFRGGKWHSLQEARAETDPLSESAGQGAAESPTSREGGGAIAGVSSNPLAPRGLGSHGEEEWPPEEIARLMERAGVVDATVAEARQMEERQASIRSRSNTRNLAIYQ